jgi:hypothetical protein
MGLNVVFIKYIKSMVIKNRDCKKPRVSFLIMPLFFDGSGQIRRGSTNVASPMAWTSADANSVTFRCIPFK